MKKRFALLLLIPLSVFSIAAVDTQSYDLLHRFVGDVAKMTIVDGENTETVYFDEDGAKIFSELSYKDHTGNRVEQVAAFDNSGVRVIYYKYNGADDLRKTVYESYRHKDCGLPAPIDATGVYKEKDNHSNWTIYKVPGGHEITRRFSYYGEPEVTEAVEWARRQRSLMFQQEEVETDEITGGKVAFLGGMMILGIVSVIPLMIVLVFGVCLIFSYGSVRAYFNKKAEDNILPSKFRMHKRDIVASIFGGVYGLMMWAGALFGSEFGEVCILAGLVWLIIYFVRLAKRFRGCASAKAVKWYMIYSVLLVVLCVIIGAVLSILAIAIAVASLAGKGISYVWDDSVSHKLPSEDGSGSSRKCSSCSYYSRGFCSYHNRAMPPGGGCGAAMH